MQRRLLYILSGLALILFTLLLAAGVSRFVEEKTVENVLLAVNESVVYQGANVRVTNVIYSPCPTGSQCIWSGLAATFEVTREGVIESMQLEEGAKGVINHVPVEVVDVQESSVIIRLGEI